MSDIIRFPQLGRTSKFDTSALTAAEEEAADLKMSDLYEAQTRSPSVDRKNFEVSSDSIADFPRILALCLRQSLGGAIKN